MITHIKCPEVCSNVSGVKIFLAGGITNCPDWQAEVVDLARQMENYFGNMDVVLINPRRDNFDVNNPDATVEQIKWEHDHLSLADMVLFWFPKETLCPITLFELGKIAAGSAKPIVVGTHPEYQRRTDVIQQLSYIRGEVQVVDNFNNLMFEIFLELDLAVLVDTICLENVDE